MLLRAFFLIAGFAWASQWGIEGVAIVWLLVHPVVALPSFAWTVRALRITGGDLRRVLGPAAALTMAGILVMLLCERAATSIGAPQGLATPIALALGAVTYLGLGAHFFRGRIVEMLGQLRRP
jgi:hypothetical protein